MNLVLRILWNALGLLLIAEFVPGIQVDGFYTALVAAVILGLLNAVVRPILLILTLPVTVLTLGLFAFVINASLFLFAASFIEGFSVTNFWYALLGSLLMSIVSTLGSRFINDGSKRA
jgi:putative membrane protein